MRDKIFLDTNVLFYQFSTDLPKKEKAIEILTEATLSDRYVISFQVIQEFSNIALTKGNFSIKELNDYVKDILVPLCKFYPDSRFYSDTLKIKEKYKYSYYDSLIIGAALEMHCKYIFTEDLQTNQRIETLEIINPFEHRKPKRKKS